MSIQKIDAGLASYYKTHGRDDYFNDDNIGKFEASCEENGFGEEDIADELETSAEECMLLDFDDNFPGVKEGDLEAIFAIIKQCHSAGKEATFVEIKEKDATIQIEEMKYSRQSYEISNKDEQSIGDQYKNQCPKSFLGTIEKDISTFKLMIIGQKQDSPYIQNLVDDYLRCRVDVFLKTKQPLAVTDWMKNHPHFKMLKNISNTNLDLVSAAVKGFV
eukprot:150248_1